MSNFGEQLSRLVQSKAFWAFIVAGLVWLADFLKSNSNLTYEGFFVGFVGFLGTYITLHLSVSQTVKKVESGKIGVSSAVLAGTTDTPPLPPALAAQKRAESDNINIIA